MRSSLNIASSVKLNNGLLMPMLGLGTWRLHGDAAVSIISAALENGIRLIDTASMYGNEEEVGQAIKESGLAREEVFITTKLWAHEHGKREAKEACVQSLGRLGLDHLDLYLIHWPSGGRNVETWEGMVGLLNEGLVRSIGVSNFGIEEIAPLIEATGVVPAVDQVEFSPYHHDDHLLAECAAQGIHLEAYSPLSSTNLHDPNLVSIAGRHRSTPAQVVLRWCLQKGAVTLFKTSHRERVKEDVDLFSIHLSAEEMHALNILY